MSTSGTYTFSLNRDQLIKRAFNVINVYSLKATMNNDDLLFATDIMNGMFKLWETRGIKLWKRRIGTMFTADSTHQYELGNVSGAVHATKSYVSTTTTADAASGASTIIVNSVTGMTASDFIGIELDDGTRQWTTISSINSGTLTITLGTTLTGAATSGNTVVTYTTKIIRPLRILRMTSYDLNTGTETPVSKISHDEYMNTSMKTSPSARPNQFYYDRLISNTLPYTGTLYLYPECNDVDTIVKFTFLEPIQDVGSATSDFDYPQEWTLPIIINLACELAPFYERFDKLQVLQPKADMYLQIIEDFDSDDEDMMISLDRHS